MDLTTSNYFFLFSYFSRLLGLFLCTLVLQGHIQANEPETADSKPAPDALLLLADMDKANHSNSFKGLLTYEANGYMSTMQLTQTVSDNVINQRLNFLDGPMRQVSRKNILSDCDGTIPDQQSWPRKIELDKLVKVYDITFDGVERIADRKAYTVAVNPRDDHRYGYRFSVDSETGLLLKTLLVANNTVVERLQFVELRLYPGGDTDLLKIDDDVIHTQVLTSPASEPCQLNEIDSGWKASWLPEGFLLLDSRMTDHGEQALVFSDGLATLSVFIIDQNEPVIKATARYGATVAVMLPLKGVDKEFMAVVVGEIPIATARQIAVSLLPH